MMFKVLVLTWCLLQVTIKQNRVLFEINSMLDTCRCSTHTILSFVMKLIMKIPIVRLSEKEEDLSICCWFIREWGVLSLSFLLVFEFIIVV